jgi:predicted TIM-barrel fold metal-dependent hydrolase
VLFCTALLALPLSACGAPETAGSAPELPGRIIDAHVHADFSGAPGIEGGPASSRAELLGAWREANVSGAVSDLGEVRYCLGVDAEPDAAALESALASGAFACLKVYLGYVHQFASDPRYAPVYQAARRHRVPVVFHTGDTSSPDAMLKYADPLTIDEVAVDHRDVTFVIAHCGNPWLASAAEVAYKNPNVYLECSALMTGDMAALPPETVQRYVTDAVSWVFGYVEDPTKLMFGSDWPLVTLPSYVRAYAAGLPREHWDAVFYGNAARVFGFRTGSP